MTTSMSGAARPLRAPTPVAGPARTAHVARVAVPGAAGGLDTGIQLRIFAVDSRPLLRSGLAGVARRAFGAGALPVSDLDQAAAASRFLDAEPRAVLLGLRTGDDPAALLEHARRIAATVILVLDLSDAALIRAALAAGADGYMLVEQTNPDELRSTLEAAETGIRAIPPELHHARPGGAEPAAITDRCLEVLRLLAAGLHDDEIASELAISTSSVRKHVANAQQRLAARTRTQAVALATRGGLL